jgi:SAM-dependent methyltransferase
LSDLPSILVHSTEPYAPTRVVTDPAECHFYHREELPGLGLVGSEWDLRAVVDSYLGRVTFAGQRVLEMGTASGYLCRQMEARGAEVVAFDLSPEGSWDFVPFAGLDVSAFGAGMKHHIHQLNNAWWLAHRLCGSKARVVYGDIYDMPASIGPVDVATFGAILLHLRDPFRALENALRLTRETVVVTEVHPDQPAGSALGSAVPSREHPPAHPGAVYFAPDPESRTAEGATTWWSLPPEAIRRFLGVLGFGRTQVLEHEPLYKGKKARFYTVVGTRTRPAAG